MKCLVEHCIFRWFTADYALSVLHYGNSITGHVRHVDAQQLLVFPQIPQANVLRRARRHQLGASPVVQSTACLVTLNI